MSKTPAPAPAAAKLAAPKKPSKKEAGKAALSKKVADLTAKPVKAEKSAKASAEKLPYNFRTRSLVRAFIGAIEDPAAKKEVRAAFKELRSFEEIREKAIAIADASQFDELVAAWFNAGEEKEKSND